MDEFDEFNPNTQNTETLDEQDTNNQEDDPFGSAFAANTTTVTSTNPFNSEQKQHQQEDLSWAIDDDVANTTTTTAQTNLFDDDTLDNFISGPQTTSFNDDLFTNQLNTNELDSYPTTNLPLPVDELLSNNSSRPPSANSLSFNMFPNSVSSTTTNHLHSTENLSRLEEFNSRRQQEIAEMDAIEKQKIEELRQQGKKELERWYEDRRTRMEQKRQSIKQEQDVTVTQALEKSDKNTCDWAKVIRFIDFSQGTQITKHKRDLNRMRAVIIQAQRDKNDRISENGV